jgi:two-component system, OmpR family, phosphate regulon sensor histidine kinase PhoR
MKTRLLISHLAAAGLVLIAARSGIGLAPVVLIALAVSWIAADIAWRPLDRTFGRIAGWIKKLDTKNGGAKYPELDEIAGAIDDAADRFNASLSQLTTDKHTADQILNNMRDGVLLTDTSAKVVLANPAAGKIFRLPRDEFIGRPLIYSIHSQELNKLINQVIAEGEESEAEIEIFMPRERRLRAVALPVGPPGEITSVLTVFQDMTTRRRVEALRRDFVANVSHELKTPVAGISLLADSLIASIGHDEKSAGRFAAKLRNEAKLLAQLVSDLLDLSQLESPETKPIFTSVSLSKVVQSVVTGFTESAAAKGLSLRTELAADVPPVSGSEEQLRLMLRNLVENAVHYTPTGGDVLIKTSLVDRSAELEVSDTGIGIPAGDLKRVFERFYRIDKARSRETGGTGLGLSIVKHVVDNHKGQIDLESVVGVGSKFRVSLPLQSRPRVRPTKETPLPSL